MLGRCRTAATVWDIREDARRRLPRIVFDFIDGGAEDEFTVRENRRAFSDVALRPRVLVDVTSRSQRVRVLGQDLDLPVILGPAGLARLTGRAGEAAAAIAADRQGTVSVISSGSSVSFEEVAASVAGPQWFQLYPWGARHTIETVIDRAKRCGYQAMVVTVDVPVVGSRDRDRRNGLTIPPAINPRTAWDVLSHPRWLSGFLTGPKVTFANFADLLPRQRTTSGLAAATQDLLNPGQTWADLEWMCTRWNGPVRSRES